MTFLTRSLSVTVRPDRVRAPTESEPNMAAQIVRYHGSIREAHGDYTIANAVGHRFTLLPIAGGHALYHVRRESFSVVGRTA